MATAGVMLLKGPQARRYTQKAVHKTAVCGRRRSHVLEGAIGKAVHTEGGAHNRRSMATAGVMLLKGPQARRDTKKAVHTQGGTHKRRSVATAGVLLLIYGGGGVLVYGDITTRGGDGLNRTFGRPKVRPDFRPFFRPKQWGGDGVNHTFGRPKVRRADKSAEPISPPNPRSGLIR